VSYQVLARKWRPQTFEAVVGQDAITRTLRNALASGRVAHAYLFAGPRGVGKTTTARLLAKALLCPERKDAEACGTCAVCRDTSMSVDVIEIDGASNRGIADVQALRDKLQAVMTDHQKLSADSQVREAARLISESEGSSPLAWQGGRLAREVAALWVYYLRPLKSA